MLKFQVLKGAEDPNTEKIEKNVISVIGRNRTCELFSGSPFFQGTKQHLTVKR